MRLRLPPALPATVHSSVLAATRWITTKTPRDRARVDKMGRPGFASVWLRRGKMAAWNEREQRRRVRGWADSADWTGRTGLVRLVRLVVWAEGTSAVRARPGSMTL